jgi:hypothetical protein
MPLNWDHLEEVESERVYCRDANVQNYVGSRYTDFKARQIQFHKGTNFRITKTKRFLSAEIEVHSINNFKETDEACHKWSASIVSDGSLGRDGFEINTSPASGNKFVEQITEITDSLNNNRGRVSRKCGLHVHIDARDFDFDDIIRLIHLYAKLEDGLFKVVSSSRRRNTYCAECGEALLCDVNKYSHLRDFEEVFARVIYKGDKKHIEENKKWKDGGNRYRALNLHSWVHRGSIECRLHQGTTSKIKVINWATLWGVILDFAKENSMDQIYQLPDNSFEALLEVAQHTRLQSWLNQRNRNLNY